MNVRRGLSRAEGQDVVTRLQANCTARSGLIQESVGADVRRLCFIGILKVRLLTSAPTLPRYLESAVGGIPRFLLRLAAVFSWINLIL